MKYKAIIETDDYKDFEFFEDGNGKYLHGIDAGSVNGEWILLYFKEEQEPKTGHWVRVDKNKLRCSECEVIHLIAQYPNGKIDWCPNCGAKMHEVEDGNK